MAKKEFAPDIKKKVREAAGFRCCLCRERPCFHIHHIEPEKNDFDNAIPLCELCHSYHGEDSSKKKILIDARDDWYKQVKERRGKPDSRLIEEIYMKLGEIEEKTITKEELKKDLIPLILDNLLKMEGSIRTYYKKGDDENALKYIEYLSSSSTCSASLLKAIDNVDQDKKEIKINDIFPAGGMMKGDKKCPFCGYDLNQFFYIPEGKCPNCGRDIWYI